MSDDLCLIRPFAIMILKVKSIFRRTRILKQTGSIAFNPIPTLHSSRRREGDDMDNLSHKVERGIHPVATAILLISVLLTIAGITYIWMSMGERAGHAIQIASIGFGETKTTIYAQNVGEGSLSLDSVYMDNKRLLITPLNCTVASQQSTTIEKGQTAEITVNQGYGQKVHIKVICRDGTFIEGDWTP
jgi:hypothetical protein